MSTVKSFSVGEGDMFYINHNSDNFTTIDCCLYKKENVKDAILNEIAELSKFKSISRFISTHPHDDHISGLIDYEKRLGILNFYRVDNEATSKNDTEDFKRYCQLRDDTSKSFSLHKGCKRRWMNESDDERKSSGLFCLWPDTSNQKYKDALQVAKEGGDPNNISPAIKYAIDGGYSYLWMGDMETDMQKEFEKVYADGHVSVVFAPHHGRASGSIPSELLSKLSPNLIVVGEAPAKDLDYYKGYLTITQNTAGDIRFELNNPYIDIFVSNPLYEKDGFLYNYNHKDISGMYYLGSIKG